MAEKKKKLIERNKSAKQNAYYAIFTHRFKFSNKLKRFIGHILQFSTTYFVHIRLDFQYIHTSGVDDYIFQAIANGHL